MKSLERFIWLAVLASCTVVLLSFATSARSVDSSVVRFWWHWLLLFALAIGLSLSVIGWILDKATGRQLSALLLGLAGLALVGLTFVYNGETVANLFGFGEGPPQRLSSGLTFLLLLVAIVLTITWGRGRGWWYRIASILAIGAFVLWIRSAGPTPAVDPSDLPQTRLTGQRLLVIGLDGADWRYIDPLIVRGELPNIQRLVETGVRGPLATMRPTLSPALWTTMVTGKRPQDHGIQGHAVVHPKGGRHQMPKPGKMAKGFGVPRLYKWLTDRGQIVRSPATSLQRQVPAYWNISTAYDSPLDVVNWWATWPAEAILGRMVTDRTYFWRWAARGFSEVDEAITFPDSLYRQLAPMVVRPDEVSLEDARQFMDIDEETFAASQDVSYRHHELLSEFKYYYSMFETHRRFVDHFFARAEAEGVTPSDMMVIYRLPDMLSHSSLRFSELVEDHLDSSPEDIEHFGRAVTEAYRQADQVVGEMVSAFGEGNVIVISDHGFVLEGRKRKKTYNHKSGPSGIFLASGPALGQGEVENLSLFHLLPIMLAIKGFPVPADIVVDVPVEIFAPGFLDTHPPTRIDSYGTIDLGQASGESAVDQEMMERLEALGYLD